MARRLLPLETARTHPDSSTTQLPVNQQKRKRPNGILAVACLACQKRKTKCDGARPSCRSCSSKNAPCVYDAPEGQTRIAALKIRNSDLQTRLTSSVNLLWSLKTLPPESAAEILERIRASDDPSAILDSFAPEPTSLKRPRSPDAPASASASNPSSSSSSSQTPPSKRPNCARTGPGVILRPGDPFHPSSEESSDFAMLRSPVCREAFLFFLKCTGILFYIFTREQGNAAFDDVLRSEGAAISKISMCEVCAMAAVGTQYSQGKIPALTGQQFYNIARHFLDDAIELDPLRGMKICALLAFYNIVIKGSVALAFIEMGIGLGARQDLSKSEAPPGFSAETWLDYKRVWRTLLCCKGWLVATLGYSSCDDWTDKIDASRATVAEKEVSTTESIQIEMTRLAIIKAKIFQATFVFSNISKDTIDNVRAELRKWYKDLDPSMQLAQLTEQTSDPNFRRGIYLVHCLHLGGMILVQRRILQNYVPTVSTDPGLADSIVRDLSDAIEEGFTAALTCARILDLVHAADGVFQRCWLCIFQSYISTVEILFMIAQKLLHGYPKAQCFADLVVAGRSLLVLKFCAETDHIGRELLTTVQPSYDYLASLMEEEKQSMEKTYSFGLPQEAAVAQPSLPWEILLKLPPGESQLHETSRRLMRQLCHPFTNIRSITNNSFEGPLPASVIPMSMGNVEEYTLGAHLDWSNETGIGQRASIEASVGEEIAANVEEGFFVNSAEPCGWTSGGSCVGSRSASE